MTDRGIMARATHDRCESCRHFQNDAGALEAVLPGLTILSSALASVLGEDGLCTLHDRICRRADHCAAFS
jgi:hypothetical protein